MGQLGRYYLGLATFLFLTIYSSTSWALVNSQTPSPKQDLQSILQRSTGQKVAELVRLAEQAAALGDDKANIQAIEEAIKQADPEKTLVLAKALMELDELEKAVQPLCNLLDPKFPEEIVAASAAFLGDPRFIRNPEVEKKLTEFLTTDLLDPQLRIATAISLYKIGGGDKRMLARKELRSFLDSQQTALQRQGALALAEIGDLETALPILREMAIEPTDQGKLAKSFLDREELERLYERKIQNIEEYYRKDDKGDKLGVNSDPTNLNILEEVIRNSQHAHIRGELYDREELVAAAARGILNELDPFSNYITGQEYKRFVFDINQDYGGIGAFVRNIEGVFTIIRPIYSGPAYEMGLRSDDKILEVDGWSTAGQNEDIIIKRLKGKPGTLVKVLIYRVGWSDPREFEVVRKQINVPVLQYELLPGDIGYFELISFSRDSGKELTIAVNELLEKGMKGMVLDLRNDPGGLLDAAVNVCEIFLPSGSLVVYTESRLEGKKYYHTNEAPGVPENLPLTVLVNERSASASEIVAGALQHHGRANVVGKQTYGKGSVQTLIPLRSLPDEPYTDENHNFQWDDWEKFDDANGNGEYDYGSRIKLTVARYFFPSGKSIHTERDKLGRVTARGGVTPDLEIDFPDLDRCNLNELERVLTLKSKAHPEIDVFREYVQTHLEKHADLLLQLAQGDGKDASKYPNFDQFYKSLETFLDRNEVRKWLRLRVRELVSDARGKVFPGDRFLGDYQEDPQLQKGLEFILNKLGRSMQEIPEYQTALAKKFSSSSQGG